MRLVRALVGGLAAALPAAESASAVAMRNPRAAFSAGFRLLRAVSLRRAALSAASGDSSPFIQLPHHFSELYNESVRRVCSECGGTPLQPAICLLCGQLVCAAADCCRAGGDEECCRHAQARHSGVAAYLVVRRADTLLVLGSCSSCSSSCSARATRASAASCSARLS